MPRKMCSMASFSFVNDGVRRPDIQPKQVATKVGDKVNAYLLFQPCKELQPSTYHTASGKLEETRIMICQNISWYMTSQRLKMSIFLNHQTFSECDAV